MTESGKKIDAIGQQLALLESDPAAGILAVADLREERAKAATPGPWGNPAEVSIGDYGWHVPGNPLGEAEDSPQGRIDAIFGAAEHPGVALAAVRRWRGVAERHLREADSEFSVCRHCVMSGDDGYLAGVESWPCPDLTETADEARAYLGRP